MRNALKQLLNQFYQPGDCRAVKEQLVDVSEICGSNSAFAVVKSDGTVVSWGDCAVGGDSRASEPLWHVDGTRSERI